MTLDDLKKLLEEGSKAKIAELENSLYSATDCVKEHEKWIKILEKGLVQTYET